MQAIPLQVVIPPDLLAAILRDQLPDMIRQAVADMSEASPTPSASFDPEDETTRAALRDVVVDILENEADIITSAIEDTRAFSRAVENAVDALDLGDPISRWVSNNPDAITTSLRDNGDIPDTSDLLEKVADALRGVADNLS